MAVGLIIRQASARPTDAAIPFAFAATPLTAGAPVGCALLNNRARQATAVCVAFASVPGLFPGRRNAISPVTAQVNWRGQKQFPKKHIDCRRARRWHPAPGTPAQEPEKKETLPPSQGEEK